MQSKLVLRPGEDGELRVVAVGPPELHVANRGRPRTLRGLTLRADGLVEHRGRSETVTPWDEVYAVDRKPSCAVVQLAGRSLVLDQRFGDWLAAADEIEARAVWLQPERRGEEVSDEAIARWLGIPIDGSLSCRNDNLRWLGAGLILLYLLVVVGSIAGGQAGTIGSMTMVLMMGVAALASANRITADVGGIGLRVGNKPKTYAWDEIESVANSGQAWTVTTTVGEKFALAASLKNLQPLIRALQHVAAARKAGALLPDERPISDVALSRPGEPVRETGAEKGLSRSEAQSNPDSASVSASS